MAVDERARRKLAERLYEVLGGEATDTLMEEIGSLGRDQLATRHDLQLGFSGVERDMAELRGEMAQLRGDLRQEMAQLRGDLRQEIAAQGSQVSMAIAQQTRQLGVWILASQTTIAGIVFAASRL